MSKQYYTIYIKKYSDPLQKSKQQNNNVKLQVLPSKSNLNLPQWAAKTSCQQDIDINRHKQKQDILFILVVSVV